VVPVTGPSADGAVRNNDAYLDDRKVAILEVQQCARDQEGTMLVWTGEAASAATPAPVQAPAPLA